MLQLEQSPLLRVRAPREKAGSSAKSMSSMGEQRELPGEPLDDARSLGACHEAHRDLSDGLLHVDLELR